MRYLFGDYALDTSRCELRRTGVLIELRPKVFDVLSYLIAHRDRVISQQELLEHLWLTCLRPAPGPSPAQPIGKRWRIVSGRSWPCNASPRAAL